MASNPPKLLVRWPIGRHLDSEQVANPAAALTVLASHHAEPLGVIQDRLERGETLRSLAYEYRLLEVKKA